MPTEQDSQLGKIAVKNKLLSEEQVSKCLAEVSKTEKRGKNQKKLSAVLIERGLLTRAQVKTLLRAVAYRDLRLDDKLYGRIAIKNKFTTLNEVQEALAGQKRQYMKGQDPQRLGRILMDMGFIDADQDRAVRDATKRLDPTDYFSRQDGNDAGVSDSGSGEDRALAEPSPSPKKAKKAKEKAKSPSPELEVPSADDTGRSKPAPEAREKDRPKEKARKESEPVETLSDPSSEEVVEPLSSGSERKRPSEREKKTAEVRAGGGGVVRMASPPPGEEDLELTPEPTMSPLVDEGDLEEFSDVSDEAMDDDDEDYEPPLDEISEIRDVEDVSVDDLEPASAEARPKRSATPKKAESESKRAKTKLPRSSRTVKLGTRASDIVPNLPETEVGAETRDLLDIAGDEDDHADIDEDSEVGISTADVDESDDGAASDDELAAIDGGSTHDVIDEVVDELEEESRDTSAEERFDSASGSSVEEVVEEVVEELDDSVDEASSEEVAPISDISDDGEGEPPSDAGDIADDASSADSDLAPFDEDEEEPASDEDLTSDTEVDSRRVVPTGFADDVEIVEEASVGDDDDLAAFHGASAGATATTAAAAAKRDDGEWVELESSEDATGEAPPPMVAVDGGEVLPSEEATVLLAPEDATDTVAAVKAEAAAMEAAAASRGGRGGSDDDVPGIHSEAPTKVLRQVYSVECPRCEAPSVPGDVECQFCGCGLVGGRRTQPPTIVPFSAEAHIPTLDLGVPNGASPGGAAATAVAASPPAVEVEVEAEEDEDDDEGPLEGFWLPAALRFEEKKELSKSPFSRTYRALDRFIGETVIVKRFSGIFDPNEEAIEKALRVSTAINELDLFPFPLLYEMHRDDDGFYMVGEDVAGELLPKTIGSRGRLDERYAIRLVRALAEALSKAHAKELFHRDIRPKRIVVEKSGEGRILDFGMARLLEDLAISDPQTRKAVVGHPGYVAPERQDDLTHADAQSDIYSLGAVLCYALTGESPSKKTRGTLTGGVRRIIDRALNEDPDERYEEIADFAAELADLPNIGDIVVPLARGLFCGACGQPNTAEEFFCAACDEELLTTCPDCGREVRRWTTRCAGCGMPLRKRHLAQRKALALAHAKAAELEKQGKQPAARRGIELALSRCDHPLLDVARRIAKKRIAELAL